MRRRTIASSIEIFTILSVLLFLMSCRDSISMVSTNKSRIFTNQEGGYSLEYPSGWIAFELPNGQHGEKEVTGIIVMQNQDSPNIYIRQVEKRTPSLDEAIQWGEVRLIDRYSDVGTFQLETLKFSDLNGKKIAKRTYTISFPNKDVILKNQDVYIVTGNSMYMVTFSSTTTEYNNQIEVFDEIMSSFQVDETP